MLFSGRAGPRGSVPSFGNAGWLCTRRRARWRIYSSPPACLTGNPQRNEPEDYLLSKQVARSKFAIVRGGVYTTNRRFQKMGHFRVARLFLKTAFNYWNEQHFLRDHNYWQV